MRHAQWAFLIVVLGRASLVEAFLPPSYGGKIVAPLPDKPVVLDPAQVNRESELQLMRLLFDTLYRLSPDNKPVPHLILPEPEISEDGMTWRFHLRQGIVLHDGSTLTAQHVEQAFRRLQNGPNRYILGPIIKVAAQGSHLFEITLSRQAKELPWILSTPPTAIAVRRKHKWIGSGPFQLASWRPDVVLLEAHRRYFDGRPYLDHLRLISYSSAAGEVAAFHVGTSQLSFRGTSVFSGTPRYPFLVTESPLTTLVFVKINRHKPFLASAQFRLALIKGIDRSRLGRLATTGRSEVVHHFFTGPLVQKGERPIEFNREEAKRLLKRALTRHPEAPKDASSGRLRLSLLVDASRFEDRIVAGQLVANLDRLGIALTVDTQPAHLYEKRLRQNQYDLALYRQPLLSNAQSLAHASNIAAAGEIDQARKCSQSESCTGRTVSRFIMRLAAIPLVRVSTRVAYDKRLGGIHLTHFGDITFADIYWQRGKP